MPTLKFSFTFAASALCMFAVGCSNDPASLPPISESTGPTEQVVQQIGALSQGWRVLHGDDASTSMLLRREVREASLPAEAIATGGHTYFDPAIEYLVDGYQHYYFGSLSSWQSIPQAAAESLVRKVQERENLHITSPESMWVGCWSRAMLISKTLDDMGLHSKKIWLENPRAGIGPDQMWAWHVATVIRVEKPNGEAYIAVLDPAADATQPLLLQNWLAKQNLQELPVLVVEPLTPRWPEDESLRWPVPSADAPPELNHITVRLSGWEQYSLEKCEGTLCREDESIDEKVKIARGELKRGGA